MRLVGLAILATSVAFAAPVFRVHPGAAQGNVLRIEASGLPDGANLTATMGEKTIRLFPSGAQSALGLMPVPVTLDPGEYDLSVRDQSGHTVQFFRVKVADSHFPTQNIEATKQMKSLKPLADEVETMQAFGKTVSEKRYWAEPFLSPTPNCRNSPFGVQRLHNGKPTGNYHRGLDLRSPSGCPVKATADGVVKVSRMFRRMGGTVGIDHGQGVLSTYLHLSRVVAKEGAFVRKGDVIAYVGATGFATGPHLHWQIQVNGSPVNPLEWVPSIQECKPRRPAAKRPSKRKKPASAVGRSAGSPSR